MRTKHNKSKTARVFIVDDHPLMCQALTQLIGSESGLEVCGEAAEEAHAIRQIRAGEPDLVIVDITLRQGDGIELIKQIKAFNASIRMLVSSMHDEGLYAERALRAGAHGYVNKQDPAGIIITAIRRVLEGKTYLSEEMTQRLLQRAVTSDEKTPHEPIADLSDRELVVFELIGQGRTTAEIAAKLHLSTSTVDTYRERLKTKLNLPTATALAHRAVQWMLQQNRPTL